MKKFLLATILSFLFLGSAIAQPQGGSSGSAVANVTVAPTTCTAGVSKPVVYLGTMYQCSAGTYYAVPTTAAGGSVIGLTAGRVTVAASGTTLTDYAGFTHDGTTLTVAGLKDTALTSGRVPFATTGGLLTDSANLAWDSSNNRLTIGSGFAAATNAPVQVAVDGSGVGVVIGSGASNYIKMLNGGVSKGWVGIGSVAMLFQNDAAMSFNATIANTLYLGTDSKVGINNAAPGGQFQITAGASTYIGQIIKLAVGQSADALQVQDSTGTVLAKTTKDGLVTISPPSDTNATFTATAAGAANAQISLATAGGSTLLKTDSAGNTIFKSNQQDFYFDYYNALYFRDSSSNNKLYLTGATWSMQSGQIVMWSSSTTNAVTSPDLGIARNAAGVLEINSGTAGTYRDLKLRSIETTSVVGVGSPAVSTTALNVNKGFADVASPALLNLTGLLESTGGGTITNGYGLISTPVFESYTGGTWTNIYGLYDAPQLRPIAAASTTVVAANVFVAYLRPVIYSSGSNLGTYTNTYGSYLAAIDNQATGGTFVFTNVYGQYIANQGTPTNQAGATVTNAYGLYLASQTGATTNYAIYSAGGASLLNAGTSTVVPLTLKGAASQSGDLTQWQNSSGTYLTGINASGALIFGGSSSNNDTAIWIQAKTYSTATSLYGLLFQPTVPSTATSAYYGIYANTGTAAASFTLASNYNFYAGAPTIGASSAITNSYGLYIAKQKQTGVGTGYGVYQTDSADNNYFAGQMTFAGNFFAGPSTIESFTTNASALGTLNYYTDSQTIYYDTAAATADVTINVDASASVDLNTRLATGQMVTVVLVITNTGTAYKCNTLQIHSVGQTIKWVGGAAPTGTTNATDFYTFTIMKTGASTYYVTGSKTSYY